MIDTGTPTRAGVGFALGALAIVVALVVAVTAQADSTPIGPLPRGPVSTISTTRNQLVAVALPNTGSGTGLLWRIARPYNARVVRETTEGNVGTTVVVVFKAVGSGTTSVVFALTRGDTSTKALKAVTYTIHSAG
jgi:hypothetical protein